MRTGRNRQQAFATARTLPWVLDTARNAARVASVPCSRDGTHQRHCGSLQACVLRRALSIHLEAEALRLGASAPYSGGLHRAAASPRCCQCSALGTNARCGFAVGRGDIRLAVGQYDLHVIPMSVHGGGADNVLRRTPRINPAEHRHPLVTASPGKENSNSHMPQ